MSLKALGNRLAAARKAAHHTQRSVSDRIGVAITTISRWETGEIDPGHERLAELAEVYSVDPRELAFGKPGETDHAAPSAEPSSHESGEHPAVDPAVPRASGDTQ